VGPRVAKGMMRTSVQVPQENTREITKTIFILDIDVFLVIPAVEVIQ